MHLKKAYPLPTSTGALFRKYALPWAEFLLSRVLAVAQVAVLHMALIILREYL
jgi:hypothetical protein